MKFRNTLILFIVFLAIGAYFYFYEIRGGRARREAEERESAVLLFEKDDVRSLLIRSDEEILCRRDGVEWRIAKPVVTEGDKAAIEGIIASIERAQIDRVVEEEAQGLARFGLASPVVEVELEYETGTSDTLFLGDKNPTNEFVYARRGNRSRVFLTSSTLLSSAQKKLYDLREKRALLGFEMDEVNRVVMEHGKSTIVCVKNLGEWELEKPIQAKADKSMVEGIINTLRNARAREFVTETAEDLGKYGLKRPTATVDLLLGEAKAQKTLLVGDERDGNYYAKDESRDPVFLIDSHVVEKLKSEPFDLQDKRIVDFNRNDVDEVELRYADTTMVCRKDTAGTWLIAEPQKGKAKEWRMNGILSTLSGLRAEEFISKPGNFSRYGLSSPRIEVVLKQGEEKLAWVHVGTKKDEQVYVRNPQTGVVALVKADQTERLRVGVGDLLEEEEVE